MADDVKWIRFKVGIFDGVSFKKIKRANIDGVLNFRDKLTAIWFELLDLSGKVNNSGYLLNEEVAFKTYEDIAIALDRTEEEIKLCILWFTTNNMMEIVDDVYLITNWIKYQNIEGLEKIKEQNRERQKKYREKQKQVLLGNVNDNVTVTSSNTNTLISNSLSISSTLSINRDLCRKIKYFEDEILNSMFIDFLKMRKSIKNGAMTERAITMMVNKIKKYDVISATRMLEISIINNWKDIYDIQKDSNASRQVLSKQQAIDNRKREQMEKLAKEHGYMG